MSKVPNKTPTNFSFSLLKPVEKEFLIAMKSGCFLKKAFMERFLAIEIERLNQAIPAKCDPAVTKHIRTQQLDGQLKDYWRPDQVQLPTALVERISSVCRSKGVLRDAWVNRAIYLAAQPATAISSVFGLQNLESDDHWKDPIGNEKLAFQGVMRRVSEQFDPLGDLHEVLTNIPGQYEPGHLYKVKIFKSFPKIEKPNPKDPPLNVEEQLQAINSRNRLIKAMWSMTCWAELQDLKIDEELDEFSFGF